MGRWLWLSMAVLLLAGCRNLAPIDAATATALAPTLSPTPIQMTPYLPTPTAIPDSTTPYSLGFLSMRTGNWNLYQFDGTFRELSSSLEAEGDFAWSPDGQQLVFSSDRNGNWELYRISLVDGTLQRLTDDPAMDTDPSWSADGTRIAFASDRSGMFDLYQMPALGGDAQRFTRSGGTSREPSWSPDGTRILFTSWRDGDSEIYTLDIASGEAIQLTRNETEDRSPVWSPDGVLIAFESEYEGQPEVVVLVVNGSDPQRLTFHEAADEDPAWSPDGRYLAFTSNRDENREIYALDVNAPEQVIRLTFDCAREMFPVFRPNVGSMLPVIPFTPLITVEGEQRINLRNGPDTTFTAEADAGPDDCLTVIGRSREIGWLLVRDQRGRELWVAAELTNFAGNWDSLPLSNRDG